MEPVDTCLPTVYLMAGLPASGKTTYAAALAQATGALRLNADEYVAAHFTAEESHADWDTCFAAAAEAIWAIADAQIAAGKDVILDVGFWTRENRDAAKARFTQPQARCVIYYMDTPEAEILARLEKRTGEIARRNVQNFENLKKIFQPPEKDENALYIKPSDKPAG